MFFFTTCAIHVFFGACRTKNRMLFCEWYSVIQLAQIFYFMRVLQTFVKHHSYNCYFCLKS